MFAALDVKSGLHHRRVPPRHRARSSSASEADQPVRAEAPRCPSRARQLRDAQDARGEGVARQASALQAALHTDQRFLVDLVERFSSPMTTKRVRRAAPRRRRRRTTTPSTTISTATTPTRNPLSARDPQSHPPRRRRALDVLQAIQAGNQPSNSGTSLAGKARDNADRCVRLTTETKNRKPTRFADRVTVCIAMTPSGQIDFVTTAV